ncbi:MarR family transcriptional regulator [Gorillibacterium sp. sgz5001074]|uniref:MarR family transcriptional regulator n=1 Tax=Gorillibacterium sp. sgz5001074 TaxID=3446695 RepID=UPI003F680E9B
MEDKLSPLSLIDQISDKHMELRAKLHETDGQGISKTEAHILTVLRLQGKLTVSELGRSIHISRQGTHKCVQGLLELELVETEHSGGNVRDKPIVLTPKGLACCEKLEDSKRKLEQRIAEHLGRERMETLKRWLSEDWFGKLESKE